MSNSLLLNQKSTQYYDPVLDGEKKITISGREIWLHRSKEVVCIKFNYFGIQQILQVPLAKYRTLTAFNLQGVDIEIPSIYWLGYPTPEDKALSYPSSYLPALSDSFLQNRMSAYKNDMSGRKASDKIMTFKNTIDSNNNKGCPAVEYCRGLDISGFGKNYFDLGNTYETYVIFAESDYIDELDTSLPSYKNLALGYRNSTRFSLKFNPV